MTTDVALTPQPRAPSQRPATGRMAVGAFSLVTGEAHPGLVAADTQVYREPAPRALFAWVRDGWRDVVMATLAVHVIITFHVLLLRWGWTNGVPR